MIVSCSLYPWRVTVSDRQNSSSITVFHVGAVTSVVHATLHRTYPQYSEGTFLQQADVPVYLVIFFRCARMTSVGEDAVQLVHNEGIQPGTFLRRLPFQCPPSWNAEYLKRTQITQKWIPKSCSEKATLRLNGFIWNIHSPSVSSLRRPHITTSYIEPSECMIFHWLMNMNITQYNSIIVNLHNCVISPRQWIEWMYILKSGQNSNEAECRVWQAV